MLQNLLSYTTSTSYYTEFTDFDGMYSGMVAFFIIMPIIALVLRIAVCVWIYRDAQLRNMDSTLWLILAIFVGGLLIAIIYLIVRNDHPIGGSSPGTPYRTSPPPTQYGNPGTLYGQPQPNTFRSQTPPESPAPTPSTSGTRFCSQCGHANPSTSKFCAGCGYQLF